MIEKAITIVASAFNIIMNALELFKKFSFGKKRVALQFSQIRSTSVAMGHSLVIKNSGKREILNLTMQQPGTDMVIFTNSELLPIPQLESGREIVLYYYVAAGAPPHVELVFTYTDGKSQQSVKYYLTT